MAKLIIEMEVPLDPSLEDPEVAHVLRELEQDVHELVAIELSLVAGPGIANNDVVAVQVTPETTLVDLMAALEQSVKEAKESRKRHKAQAVPDEPVFVDVWPLDYDDSPEWD